MPYRNRKKGVGQLLREKLGSEMGGKFKLTRWYHWVWVVALIGMMVV